MIFAAYFGISSNFELFLIAAALPLTINTLIIYLGQNFIVPNISKSHLDLTDKQRYISNKFWLFFLIGIFFSAFLILFSETFINFYLTDNSTVSKDLSVLLFRIFSFSFPLSFAVSVLLAEAQSNSRFLDIAVSHLYPNLVVIILVIVFGSSSGVIIIPIANLISLVAQLIFLFGKSESSRLIFSIRISEIFRYSPAEANTFLTIIIIEAVGQFYILIDRFFYGSVDAGGIAALNYANSIFLLPISIISASLVLVLFPKFSLLLQSDELNKFNEIFNKVVKYSLLFFIPLTFIFIFYGDFIVRILFERGEFDERGTALTSQVLKYFSISLLFYAVYGVLNKIFYSVSKTKLLLLITLIGILLKFFLNFILVAEMDQNGLALSTTLSYMAFFFLSIYFLRNYFFKIKNWILNLLVLTATGFLALLITKTFIGLIVVGNFQDIISIIIFLLAFYFTGYYLKLFSFKEVTGLFISK